MYQFTRSARLAPGRMREAMTWAVEITEKVNQVSELDVGLWTTVMSPDIGRLVWATGAEDLEQLDATMAKLAADEGYLSLLDRGAEFSSGDPVDDQIVQVIHRPDPPERPAQLIAVVQAVAANGHFGQAVEVGMKIADTARRLGGSPVSFGIAVTGTYGQVQWLSAYEDMRQLQQAETAINTSPEFLELLDREAGDAYVQASSTQLIARRIA